MKQQLTILIILLILAFITLIHLHYNLAGFIVLLILFGVAYIDMENI